MSHQVEDLDLVAIIGMAGRFPGAPDVETFWDNLEKGHEGISFPSDDELLEAGESRSLIEAPNFVKAKGVLVDCDLFDAGFFGISPREAEIMDPQHRIFLQCAWQALESAGCDPSRFEGRIGVFAGATLNSYLIFNVMANQRVVDSAGRWQTLIANDKDFLTTRTSYKLNLRGPSVTVQTACSTSLTAVHLASQSLLSGECDIALAGGVSVSVPLKGGYLYEQGGILSPDGHCRAFDAGAGGTVPGNGVGVVVLRKLAEARAHGDTVSAVIRGTAINNDGSLKVGYTAPSVDGQSEVIAEALAMADVDASTVGYVEAHGTGTALGDPIEIAALTRAFREHTQNERFCAVGSVKSNVGHLDAAAGVTALIKATLALRQEAIPATLHFDRPNPELALESSPFFVNTELLPWPRQEGEPRRAGVSSFGIGGTNVHVVLEEAPTAEPAGPSRSVQLLTVSARSQAALAEAATRLADHLERHPELDLADAASTLARGRRAFEWRQAVVCQDQGEAVAALRRIGPATAATDDGHQAPVAFLFPGQGAQYVNMARDLYDREPTFARELDHCAELFAGHLGEDLRTLLFAGPQDLEAAAARLEQTEVTQPVIFTVEYALARLWCSWGVQPRAMVGHSIGEYVAACLAGVFSLQDAVRLVAARGRLVQSMPRGAMLAVFLPEVETTGWLGHDLCLAAVNSTALSVVSGTMDAIDDLQRRLTAAGIGCRRLHTSHAFHSPSLDAAVGPFVEEVRKVALSAPRIPFCSNVTGTWIADEQATSPEYWGAHLRQTVRFSDALDELLEDPALVLLEVGPGQMLSNFAREHRAYDDSRAVIGSLRHPKEKRDDLAYLLQSLGMLWRLGVPVNWAGFYEGEQRRSIQLPTYPFQQQRYWVEPDDVANPREPHGAVAVAATASVDDWFYTPGWKRLPLKAARVENATDVAWVVLGADLVLGAHLAQRLADEGGTVITVAAGDQLHQDSELAWSIDPGRREHYEALFETLVAMAPKVIRVVHLWGLGLDPVGVLDEHRLDRARSVGFDALLALAQGIGASPAQPIVIEVLCRGLRSVTGEELLQPENAPLLGMCTVIPQEINNVTCRTLDITGCDPSNPTDSTVDTIRSLLGRDTQEGDLALRGQHWWARDFDAVRLGQEADHTRLRAEGVYLVTGGLGGIGLAVAEHFADSVERPALGLLTRSEFPAPETWQQWLGSHDELDPTSTRIRRLRRLGDLGARVVVLQADVTDLAETSAAVDMLRSRFGAINGVVHAAGLASKGLIMGKTSGDVDDVLAAKTRGTLVLDQVCQGDDLDFLLLCSSLTSVLGGPGQSDYCGANAFLDVFAQWKRAAGVPVLAVGWDTWHGVGMADGLDSLLGGGQPAADLSDHPLLRRLVRSTPESFTYLTTLSTADSWIVDEHRIQGHGLVPGTTYLELVRAAVADRSQGRVIELCDVMFLAPVIVPDGQTRDLYTTVDLFDGRMHFTVRSKVGDVGAPVTWQEHATGDVLFHDREVEEPRDLEEVLRQCDATEDLEDWEEIRRRLRLDLVERGEELEFSFGQRWRCLRRIQTGERRMLVTLELDDAYLGDLDSYTLHPALLDVAGAAARILAKYVYYLPFTYRSVQIRAGLTSTVHCYVVLKESTDSSGETMTCDLELLDPQGRLLVRIVDFTIKRIHDLGGLVEQIELASAAPPEAVEDGPDDHVPSVLRVLSEGISRQDALAALDRILAAPSMPEQLVVSHNDLTALRRLASSITPELMAREVEQIAPLPGTHPRPDLETAYAAPTTVAELAIAAIWQEVLGIDRVGLNDDFFALGGHSLAAVQIGSKFRGRFGVELDLRDFFDSPTVASTVGLLEAAESLGGESAQDTIRARPREEPGDSDGDDLDGLDALSDEEVEARLQELLTAERDQQGSTP